MGSVHHYHRRESTLARQVAEPRIHQLGGFVTQANEVKEFMYNLVISLHVKVPDNLGPEDAARIVKQATEAYERIYRSKDFCLTVGDVYVEVKQDENPKPDRTGTQATDH